VQWRRRGLPVTSCAPTQIGIRVSVGSAAHGEPRSESRWPPSIFIAQCDRGRPAIDGLGAPDQGAGQGPIRPLGLIGGRSFQHSLP